MRSRTGLRAIRNSFEKVSLYGNDEVKRARTDRKLSKLEKHRGNKEAETRNRLELIKVIDATRKVTARRCKWELLRPQSFDGPDCGSASDRVSELNTSERTGEGRKLWSDVWMPKSRNEMFCSMLPLFWRDLQQQAAEPHELNGSLPGKIKIPTKRRNNTRLQRAAGTRQRPTGITTLCMRLFVADI
ncbi:hypothetical protein EVAR_2268_1 [Eumeta japonica]|uniref:Uncharacterized protein n=1 Tax=Eumeta variegata TaxID=151549 RepID=A0A4C1SFN7_EUMVA|nr:hypothetical protein EVAR_2268_1 [Eumeta japonica]